MKLKNKIAVIYTLITSAILIGVCIIIYYLSGQYARSAFYQRLNERANIIAAFVLEEDELSHKMFSDIRRKYMQSLLLEREYFINLDEAARLDTLPAFIDEKFINTVDKRRYAAFTIGDTAVVGIRYEDNQGDFAVIVAAKDRSGISQQQNLGNTLILVVLGALVLVFFAGRWYAKEMIAPLNNVIRQMHSVNASNLHLRIVENDKRDEIGQLARAFNKLLNRIETGIEAQNNFISNASHELKNPLTAILGEIEVGLRGERSAEAYRQCLLQVEKEAERLKNLSLRLLRLAQAGFAGNEEFAPARIDELLVEVVEDLQQIHPQSPIQLHFESMPAEAQELEIMADVNLLRVAIANVVENAVKFSSGKPVDVYLFNETRQVRIMVCDQGVGIPDADRGKVFDPFYRAENAVDFKGFGVGLSLARKAIEIHEGSIEALPEAQGAAIQIIIPKEQF